jgi:hypothetical protein
MARVAAPQKKHDEGLVPRHIKDALLQNAAAVGPQYVTWLVRVAHVGNLRAIAYRIGEHPRGTPNDPLAIIRNALRRCVSGGRRDSH